MIKLSILIPVYNAEEYIGKLLDCIIQQMNDAIEVILLNDGSRDSSDRICTEYEEKYPDMIHFISRENRGAVCTRRELFQAANGEWVWIIDSDDMILRDSIAIVMETISSGVPCDMILFDHYLNSEEGGLIVCQLPYEEEQTFEGEQKKTLYRKLICERELNPLWNKVFKKECVDFDSDYSQLEDVKKANDCLQMIPIITNAKTIRYIHLPLYVYNTQNQNSLSHAFHYYTYTSLKKVWIRKKEFIYKWEMWEELKEDYYSRGATATVELLRKFAWSDKTKQEYYKFFETIMTDGIFSEAVEKCDCKKLSKTDRLLVQIIKKKEKKLSYILFTLQNMRTNN